MTDYWLSKLFFDAQKDPQLGATLRRDPQSLFATYPMRPELREALLADDFEKIVPHVNAYLLRFYYASTGVKDPEFIARLDALPSKDLPSKDLPVKEKHGG